MARAGLVQPRECQRAEQTGKKWHKSVRENRNPANLLGISQIEG